MTAGHSSEPGGGDETILLVSPEAETRAQAAFVLTGLGYRVYEARHALEALQMYDDLGGHVDLVLTEAVMSRVNGHALAQALGSRNERLRILFVADAIYERLARKVAAEKGLSFLVRPFTPAQLAAKVREALDGRVRAGVARA